MIPTIGPARRTQRRRYPPTPVTPALPLNTGVQSPAAPQRARKAPGAPSRHPSPLRYPGGRARMARILARIWDGIPLRPGAPDLEVWIEPFAGGAGAALALLEAGVVDEARLIEANPAIAALWRIILDEPDRLAAHVERHTPTTTSFYASREQISALLAAGGPVNPARAGMIPRRGPRRAARACKPRASGDDPKIKAPRNQNEE